MDIPERVRDRLDTGLAELATHCTSDHIRRTVHAIVARLSPTSIRPAGASPSSPTTTGSDPGAQPCTFKTILVVDSKKHRELL